MQNQKTQLARRLASALLLPGLLSLASCYQLPPMEGRRVNVVTDGGLETASPIDIAVAPILDLSQEGAALPVDELRLAFQNALLLRRYSPLALDYIDDAIPVEASYAPGLVEEDATLLIRVLRWDESQWDPNDAIDLALEVSMIDPTAPVGAELWKATVDRRFDRGDFGKGVQVPSEPMRVRIACEAIANDVLAAMPARTSAPGRQ
ncbi:MAG: hypothetical protein AAF368_12540 [Planctomycetota bacterium]